ncbi:hypothetical protein A0J61_10909, partial [Choanephora cucurbitarum]
IESALAKSTQALQSSASPVIDQGERYSRPVVDRHESSNEATVEQEDIPYFKDDSPIASVALNDPNEIEEADEPLLLNQRKSRLLRKGPIVQQWVDDAQVKDCDDVVMKLMRVFDTNKISLQGQRNIFKLVILNTLTRKHFRTPNTYRRIISKNSSTTVRYDIYPNGCYLYPVNDSSAVIFPNENCGVARYRNATAINIENRDPTMPPPALVAKKQMAYTSISQALTQLYFDDERSEMLSYRDRFFITLH